MGVVCPTPMKNLLALILLSAVLLMGCQSKSDVLPTDVWSQGCAQLAPNKGGYLLSGICCTYVLFPLIKLTHTGSFAVDGSYHSFTGAGVSDVPTRIMGQVAPDRSTLTLQYTVNGAVSTFILRPGYATSFCYCGCD